METREEVKEETSEISFVRYIRPSTQRLFSKRSFQKAKVSAEAAEKWEVIQKLGCRITVEHGAGPMMNICVEEPSLGDYMSMLKPDQMEGVNAAVQEAIMKFDLDKFPEWKEMMS